MNKNKYLLLGSSLGVLLLLLVAAVEENFLREWRRLQRSAAAASGQVDVRLRQVVVPPLRVTDRCVSCHVGMAPGEAVKGSDPVLAAHPPVVHDPSQFGCTVCHAGQGRATEKADAHGQTRFWPEPMIPLVHAYAGCGTCHTHLAVPDLARMQQGQSLLERYDCLACHRIDGRGGTLRPGGAGGMEGPDLSHIGTTGWARDWYQKHGQQHEAAQEGPWRISFGPLEPAEREVMEAFLASRVGVPQLVEAKALFHSLGCRGCHKIRGVGGADGPDLSLTGWKDMHRLDFTHVTGPRTLSNWLVEHFRWPAKVVPGSLMPRLGLSESEIDLLTLYMLSLRNSDFPEAYWPQDRIRCERLGEREFAQDGATLYGTFCAACHGAAGEGRRYPGIPPFPAIANPDFLAAASDTFLAETIERGRPGRRMPAWNENEGGLRSEEVATLIGHLRRLGGVAQAKPERSERRWVQGDASAGRSTYAARCAGCHGPAGEGLEAPALNNRALLSSASDSYLLETIRQGRRGTPMPGFGRPSPVYPVLAEKDIESLVAFIRTWEEKPQ